MCSRGIDVTEKNDPSVEQKLDTGILESELVKSLRANIFSGRLRMTPRRATGVAKEMTASFLRFQAREQEAVVYHYGEQLATEGVGHQAILALTETLRQVCWEQCGAESASHALLGRYAFSLLAGYMAGREAYLLDEQDRAHRALERAREQNSP